MGPALVIGLLATASAAPCPDAQEHVYAAKEAVLQLDLEAAEASLLRAEQGLACGLPALPDMLAELWIVEGALRTLQRDDDSAELAFGAARRTSPTLFVREFGPDVQRRWEGATPSRELGHIDAMPDASAYRVFLDGTEVVFPVDAEAGLHLVQVTHRDQVRYGKVLLVLAGDEHLLLTELPVEPSEPRAMVVSPLPEVSEPTPAPTDSAASAWLGGGASVALGQEIIGRTDDGQTLREPPVKVMVPLEVGATLAPGAVWVRAAGWVAPLLGGSVLFSTPETRLGQMPLSVGGYGAGGVELGAVRTGVLVGVLWPGRLPLRAVASLPVGSMPVHVEGRAGANLSSARPPEPALEVVVAWTPGL